MRIFIYSRTAGHRGRLKAADEKYISINKIWASGQKTARPVANRKAV